MSGDFFVPTFFNKSLIRCPKSVPHVEAGFNRFSRSRAAAPCARGYIPTRRTISWRLSNGRSKVLGVPALTDVKDYALAVGLGSLSTYFFALEIQLDATAT